MDFDLGYKLKQGDLNAFLKRGAFLNVDLNQYFVGLRPLGEVSDPGGETLFFNPHFFMEGENPYTLFGQRAQVTGDELSRFVSQLAPQDSPRLEWQKPDKADFLNVFELILNEMDKGTLKKAVPVAFEVTKTAISDALKAHLILSVLRSDHGGFGYGFWDDTGGIIGLTPELLFAHKGDKVETMALAGTSKNAEELISDAKLKVEHQLVVQDIHERLGQLGRVSVGESAPEQFGSIYHLKTPVQLVPKPDQGHFEDLVTALHPTAALGVFPRTFDWQWLRNLGGLRRRRHYGAPIGLRSESGQGICFVAIRNIQWDTQEMWISSGAGMLAESDPEKEWSELELKRELTKKILGLI